MLLTISVICAQVSNFSALQAMVCNWCCFYKRCSSGVNQVFALHPYDFLFLYFWYLPLDEFIVFVSPFATFHGCQGLQQ